MNSIKDIMCPKDTQNLARVPRMQAIYDGQFKAAEIYNPKTIFEIGVRAGYSAHALITGSNAVTHFTGMDNDDRKLYGGPWLWWAEEMLAWTVGADVNIIRQDSQAIHEIEGTYDLIHIDGDHTYSGCLHDMHLCWPSVNPGGVMVVDDATYLPGPRKACADFTADGIERTHLIESPTGSMVYVKETADE